MRPHPRIRKTIKWGGLVIAIGLLIAWTVIAWFRVTYIGTSGDMYMLHGGWLGHFPIHGAKSNVGPGKLSISTLDMPLQWRIFKYSSHLGTIVKLPLWIPFLFAAIPTALAWHLDTLATRRLKLGACPTCSYPRTGLAPSAPCPECGKLGAQPS